MPGIENHIPTEETQNWGSFNGKPTYYAECSCGCGEWFVRFLGINSICKPQTLLIWAVQLLGDEIPGYELPRNLGDYGMYEGKPTHLEQVVDSEEDFGRLIVRFEDGTECYYQTLHVRGANQGIRMPDELPQWLQFFLIADSIIAQLEGTEDSLNISAQIEDHEISTEDQRMLMRYMASLSPATQFDDPALLN